MTQREKLIQFAVMYEQPDFIVNDPILVPHRYTTTPNIEISAFITAWISFGNRKQIILKADEIDQKIFQGEPLKYIMSRKWQEYKGCELIIYRFLKYGDFYRICKRLYNIYRNHSTMNEAVKCKKTHLGALTVLQEMFGEVNGIPDKNSDSACKRLSMFLRWMVRKNSPVDFGIWDCFKPEHLLIPVDTHVHKQALAMGITSRKSIDIKTAEEITEYFKDIFPGDACRGDFSLFGYGVRAKNARTKLEDMSVLDVVKMPLFFDYCEKEIFSLIDSREKARLSAKAKNLRLKAHPIDALNEEGYLKTGEFIVTYLKVLEKLPTNLSASKRLLIQEIGNTVFHKTMKQLISEQEKDEKEGD